MPGKKTKKNVKNTNDDKLVEDGSILLIQDLPGSSCVPETPKRKKNKRWRRSSLSSNLIKEPVTISQVCYSPDADIVIPETQIQTTPLFDNSGLLLPSGTSHDTKRLSSSTGMVTLISESQYDRIPDSPTNQCDSVALDLLAARQTVQQQKGTIQTLNQELTATTAALELMMEENKLLKKQLEAHDAKLRMQKTAISRTYELQQQLQVLNEQNKELSQRRPEEVVAQKTIHNKAANCAAQSDEVLLFRGWWDPLSAFYSDPIWYEGRRYNTAEHCYQHQKAVFHRNSDAGHRILSSKTPGEAKRLAAKLIKCNKEWENQGPAIMERIIRAKANQCQTFHNALQSTNSKLLIHNMETDSKWGCGKDGNGKNLMGKILMKVRHSISTNDTSSSNATDARSHMSHTNDTIKHAQDNILVIGNSNSRDIAQLLNKQNISASSYVFPGYSSRHIKDRLRHCKTQDIPSHVVLHSGDLDANNGYDLQDTLDLVRTAKSVFPTAQILVNGISTKVHSREIHRRIILLNYRLRELCASIPELTFMDSTCLCLKNDDIHYTNSAKSQLARIIKSSLHWMCLTIWMPRTSFFL